MADALIVVKSARSRHKNAISPFPPFTTCPGAGLEAWIEAIAAFAVASEREAR